MAQRPAPRFTRRADGRFDVRLSDEDRDAAAMVLTELVDDLDDDPGADDLRRLHPPAYEQDADRDAEYQLLAGEELRASRRAAVASSMAALDAPSIDEDQLWALLRSLNAVRLVAGTRLGIEEDAHRPPLLWFRLSPQERRRWAVFLFASDVSGEATLALLGEVADGGDLGDDDDVR